MLVNIAGGIAGRIITTGSGKALSKKILRVGSIPSISFPTNIDSRINEIFGFSDDNKEKRRYMNDPNNPAGNAAKKVVKELAELINVFAKFPPSIKSGGEISKTMKNKK